MNPFLWNLVLAFTWSFAQGGLTAFHFSVGFLLGYAVLWITGDVLQSRRYCRVLPRLVEFLLYILWETLLANLRVARDVITPSYYTRPGIIALPLDAETDTEITWLANLLSLTPGTLSLDLSEDRKELYVHVMFLHDVDKVKEQIKSGFERRLLELLR